MDASTTTINDYVRIRMPKVDILKIRKLLENNYKVDHDLAEGIAEAIDVALKDQDSSDDFASKEDIRTVDHRVDKVIDKIDSLEHVMVHMIESSRKSTIIYLGGIVGAGLISIIGILLVGLIKYMPTISKIVEMIPKE